VEITGILGVYVNNEETLLGVALGKVEMNQNCTNLSHPENSRSYNVKDRGT
jgi:hypothetical protein